MYTPSDGNTSLLLFVNILVNRNFIILILGKYLMYYFYNGAIIKQLNNLLEHDYVKFKLLSYCMALDEKS